MNSFIVILSVFAITGAIALPQLKKTDSIEVKEDSDSIPIVSRDKLDRLTEGAVGSHDNLDHLVASSSIKHDKIENLGGGAGIFENPHYDSTMHQSFIPQDAIQQYVNYFGQHFLPDTGVAIPGAAGIGAGVGSSGLPFGVQTGYEGYLVPEYPVAAIGGEGLLGGGSLFGGGSFLGFLRNIIPKFLLAVVSKLASIALAGAGIIFFGGAITAAVCSLTPLCDIKFNGFLSPYLHWKHTAKEVGKALGNEITADRVRRAAEFLQAAISKYDQLQKIPSKSE